MFTIELERPSGDRFELKYDHRTSELVTPDGDEVVVLGDRKMVFDDAISFSPSNPLVGKRRKIDTLKIQLGLKCNYSCSYCSQSTHIGEGTLTNIDDAVQFMTDLDTWMEGSPSSVEIWGGEPLVYWKMITYLAPELRKRFPEVKLSFFTNGSLLNNEKVEFIKKYDIGITMSHDGPGQHIRGDDPFEDETVFHSVKRLVEEHSDFTVNAVISHQTADVNKTVDWFKEHVHPDIKVAFEGVVDSHGDNGFGTAGSFDADSYQVMIDSIKRNIHDVDLDDAGFLAYTRDFINSIFHSVQATANGQKCGMDRQDTMAVDLKGNVMTCHNTGAEGEHGLGSVFDLDNVALDTSWHWSERPDCGGCPYLQICKGACMFLSGNNWVDTCENNYHYSKAIFEAVIERLVGATVVGFRGHHTRPKKREHTKIDLVDLS